MPGVLIVVYDKRASGSGIGGDSLHHESGMLKQSMWLTRGVGDRDAIMSVFMPNTSRRSLREILSIPDYIDIAFACRLGYPQLNRADTCGFAERFATSPTATRLQLTATLSRGGIGRPTWLPGFLASPGRWEIVTVAADLGLASSGARHRLDREGATVTTLQNIVDIVARSVLPSCQRCGRTPRSNLRGVQRRWLPTRSVARRWSVRYEGKDEAGQPPGSATGEHHVRSGVAVGTVEGRAS